MTLTKIWRKKFPNLTSPLRSKNEASKRCKSVMLTEHNRKRRNAILQSFSEKLFLFLFASLPTQRRYWIIEYEQSWFEKMWENRHEEIFFELWSREFRLNPNTFEFVVNLVAGNMTRQDTHFRNVIKINKRVAVAIWRLSTGNSYRTVGKVFGLGKSTVVKIVNTFCLELFRIAPQFIKFPNNGIETASEIQRFKVTTECVIPQVLGAIDGTHVEIISPNCDSKVDYYSRKQKYTVNTQAVVGGNLMFLDVATGFPGSIHDARVLRATSLFQKAEQGIILKA